MEKFYSFEDFSNGIEENFKSSKQPKNSDNVESKKFISWINKLSEDIEELNKINAHYKTLINEISEVIENLKRKDLSYDSNSLENIRNNIRTSTSDKGYVYCVVPSVKTDRIRGFNRNVLVFEIHSLNTDILCFKKDEKGNEKIYLIDNGTDSVCINNQRYENMRLVPLENTFSTLEEAKNYKSKLERQCYPIY